MILTENLFGDILSDELSVIGGSIGLLQLTLWVLFHQPLIMPAFGLIVGGFTLMQWGAGNGAQTSAGNRGFGPTSS